MVVYTVDDRSKKEKMKGFVNTIARGANTAWKATKTVAGVIFGIGFVVGAASVLPTTMFGKNSSDYNNEKEETNT